MPGRGVKSRTASDMDGTLHTDLAGFENIRNIKKVLYNHFNNLKSYVDSLSLKVVAQKISPLRPLEF